MNAHLEALWKNSDGDACQRLREAIALYKLDPWESMQRECGIPSSIPLRQLSPELRELLGVNSKEQDGDGDDDAWVDYLAIGIYVGLVCCVVCLVCIHFLVHPFPHIIRDLVTAGMFVPVLVMAFVQIRMHTNPYKSFEAQMHIKNISLRGLQNCAVDKDAVTFHDLALCICKGDNTCTEIKINEAKLKLLPGGGVPRSHEAWDITTASSSSSLEKHYVNECRQILWQELRPLIVAALEPPAPRSLQSESSLRSSSSPPPSSPRPSPGVA